MRCRFNMPVISHHISESSLTAHCFQWAWNQYPKTRHCLFHIANEGKRSLRYGAQQKAMGLIAGVPDFAFIHNGITHYCELKTSTGVLSPTQHHIHKVWSENGVIVTVCNSIEAFQLWFSIIIKPLSLTKRF